MSSAVQRSAVQRSAAQDSSAIETLLCSPLASFHHQPCFYLPLPFFFCSRRTKTSSTTPYQTPFACCGICRSTFAAC
jgi:hypothetical protein